MKHAVLGAGGIGGLLAACLAKSGDDVALVVRPGAGAGFPKSLNLESPFGSFTVPLEIAETVPSCDLLWIAVKATDLESAIASCPDDISPGAVIPLLNGIDHVAVLRARFGHNEVIPATIGVESERTSPGHIVQRSPFARINALSTGRARLESSFAQLRQIGFECKFLDDEATLLWSKLVYLAPMAMVTSAAGASVGEVVSDPGRWQQVQDCASEACQVARAEGALVNADKVIALLRSLPPGMRSSMQKDVEQKKPTELDAIAGPILRAAAHHQVECPATVGLVAEIRKKLGLAK